MSVLILTDSHCGLSPQQGDKMGIKIMPMPFMVDGIEYYEDGSLSRDAFYDLLAKSSSVSTSQLPVGRLLAALDEGLAQYDEIVYMPLSSGLSGSCSTAQMLAKEEPYKGRVFVVDNGRVSTPMYRSVLDAMDLAAKGFSAEEIARQLTEARSLCSIYLTVPSLESLRKGGRVSGAAAVLGTLMGIRPVLSLDVGKLELYQKPRGMLAAKKLMIQSISADMGDRFADWTRKNAVQLMVAHSLPEEEAAEWVKTVRAAFPGMPVLEGTLSMGISCHTGSGAVGIGVSCAPQALCDGYTRYSNQKGKLKKYV